MCMSDLSRGFSHSFPFPVCAPCTIIVPPNKIELLIYHHGYRTHHHHHAIWPTMVTGTRYLNVATRWSVHSRPRIKYGVIVGLLSFLECEMEEISPINYYVHHVKHHFWEFPRGTLLVDNLTTKPTFGVHPFTSLCPLCRIVHLDNKLRLIWYIVTCIRDWIILLHNIHM